MACERCIATQKKIIGIVCKNPLSKFCIAAKNRLAKMGGTEEEAAPAQTYQTRMMTAEPVAAPVVAPYGYKADGTPRQRPGRPAKAE